MPTKNIVTGSSWTTADYLLPIINQNAKYYDDMLQGVVWHFHFVLFQEVSLDASRHQILPREDRLLRAAQGGGARQRNLLKDERETGRAAEPPLVVAPRVILQQHRRDVGV